MGWIRNSPKEDFEEIIKALKQEPKTEKVIYIPARGSGKILSRIDVIEDIMKQMEEEEDGKNNECC